MNWEDLRELREHSQRPKLLCVTTQFWRCAKQAEEGAMIIVHKPGEPFPVELLHRLNVELHLDDCSQTFRLAKAMKAKGITPEQCSAWCACEQRLSICISPNCEHNAQCAEGFPA